jgi:proteic killer suppression protein
VVRYYFPVIKSFHDRNTEKVFRRELTRYFPEGILPACRRKLQILNAAGALSDLRVPPGNRLEALKGNRDGQYSIRVNDQWRICFRWDGSDAYDVEIVDYH